MPLEPFLYNNKWWARGRVTLNGRVVSGYIRKSTGAANQSGARQWIEETTQKYTRAAILGQEHALTFSDVLALYKPKPADAKFLLKILPHLGHTLVSQITPQSVRDLCPLIYPHASTDTWRRQVLTPVSAVINNAHDTVNGVAPIRIKGFSAQARIDQDAKRGKQSRPAKIAGNWEWIRQVQAHANPYLAAALEFMFETGARIGQVIAITPDDLDLSAQRVWVIAQKGHAAQWVAISPQMATTLKKLPARRPHDTKRGLVLAPRTFGYANRTGLTAALRTACKRAGVDYRSPHAAGRHGFYTELRVRRGVDPITAAAAGRWASAALPDSVYAHVEGAEADIRALIRTKPVQSKRKKASK